jgi:hypothetical protein
LSGPDIPLPRTTFPSAAAPDIDVPPNDLISALSKDALQVDLDIRFLGGSSHRSGRHHQLQQPLPSWG